MKTIRVKSFLTEAIKIDDPKVKKRIIDLSRLAKEARKAAQDATNNGDEDLAKQLLDRAEELEDLIKNVNIDTLDDDNPAADDESGDAGSNNDADDGKEETAEEAADRAQDAADRAQSAADAAEQAANEARAEAQEAAENGDPKAGEKAEAAKKAAEAAQKAKEAAEAAQAAADQAQEAAENGDAQGASDAADKAENAAKEAQEATNQATGEDANGGSSSEEGTDDADGQDSAQSGGGDDSSEDSDRSNGSKNGSESDDSKGNKANDKSGSSSSNDSSDDSDDASNKNGQQDNDTEDADEADDTDDGSDDNDNDDSDSNSKGSKGKKSKQSKSGKGSSSNSDDNSDGDDSDQQDGGQSDDPIKDPFADDEDIPKMSMGGQGSKQPRDPTIDEIIKQLQGLEGEARRGAVDGLKDLLDNPPANESLHESKLTEAKKGIREMDDDEYGDLVNDTIDMIERAHHVGTIDDFEERKARIGRWSTSRSAKRELDQELNEPVKGEKGIKAREKELAEYGRFMSLKEFEMTFTEAIKNQVEEVLKEYQTYDEINPEYEDEDIVMKADVEKLELDEAIPRIRVYFDQSGSWGSNDLRTGESVIATVKRRYHDTGLCKLEVLYFDDWVSARKESSFGHGYTEAWPYILKDIRDNGADNVIIMTDSDMNDRGAEKPDTVTVSGCVWWLWRKGLNSPNCVKHLIGHRGNYEGQFFPGETIPDK